MVNMNEEKCTCNNGGYIIYLLTSVSFSGWKIIFCDDHHSEWDSSICCSDIHRSSDDVHCSGRNMCCDCIS